jgi:preprotein translocase subunit YajC
MSSSPIASIFAQATSPAPAPAATTTTAVGTATPDATTPTAPAPTLPFFFYILLFVAAMYFALIRPQTQAKKKQEDTIKSAKTGDKIVTSSGIHGVISNVKDSTVIVKVADNVKLEIEKSHIDKITRSDAAATPEKTPAAKA